MRFNIGDTIRNKISQVEGQVVRFMDLDENEIEYIVAVVPFPWITSTIRIPLAKIRNREE
jgi:hypothetical protein